MATSQRPLVQWFFIYMPIKYSPDFIVIPFLLFEDKKITPMDCRIYGVIYFLSQLKNKKCIASNKTISEIAFTTAGVARNSISRLDKLKYIKCIYKDENKKKRQEIIPLVRYKKEEYEVSSGDDIVVSGCHQVMTRVSSANDTGVSSGDEQSINSPISKNNEKEISLKRDGKAENTSRKDKLKIIETIKKEFNLLKLDDTSKWNFIYAGHLIKKCGGTANAIGVIHAAARDPFWKYKITKVKTLWANCVAIMSNCKQTVPTVSTYKT